MGSTIDDTEMPPSEDLMQILQDAKVTDSMLDELEYLRWQVGAHKQQQEWLEVIGDRTYDYIEHNKLYNGTQILEMKVGFALYQNKNINDKMKECIKKISNKIQDVSKQLNSDGIYLSVIFIPTFVQAQTLFKRTPAYELTNIVFIVGKDMDSREAKIIDSTLRVYDSWEMFKNNNKFMKCWYALPKDGKYQRGSDGSVLLEFEKSPAYLLKRTIFNALDVGSVVVGLSGAAVGITAIFVPVATPIIVSSIVSGGVAGLYGAGRNIETLVDRKLHQQSINPLDKEAVGVWLELGLNVVTVGISAKSVYSMAQTANAAAKTIQAGEAAASAASSGVEAAATSTGKAATGAGKRASYAGKAAAGASKTASNAGKAAADAGKAVSNAGKAATGAGNAASNAGKAAARAGNAASNAGKAAARAGNVASNAGKAAAGVGKAASNAGKAVAGAGKAASIAEKAAAGAGKAASNVEKAAFAASNVASNAADDAGRTTLAAMDVVNSTGDTASGFSSGLNTVGNTSSIAIKTVEKVVLKASNFAQTLTAIVNENEGLIFKATEKAAVYFKKLVLCIQSHFIRLCEGTGNVLVSREFLLAVQLVSDFVFDGSADHQKHKVMFHKTVTLLQKFISGTVSVQDINQFVTHVLFYFNVTIKDPTDFIDKLLCKLVETLNGNKVFKGSLPLRTSSCQVLHHTESDDVVIDAMLEAFSSSVQVMENTQAQVERPAWSIISDITHEDGLHSDEEWETAGEEVSIE